MMYADVPHPGGNEAAATIESIIAGRQPIDVPIVMVSPTRPTTQDIDQLYLATVKSVRSYFRYQTRDDDTARELTQESYTKLYERSQRGPIAHPLAYLWKIVRTTQCDHWSGLGPSSGYKNLNGEKIRIQTYSLTPEELAEMSAARESHDSAEDSLATVHERIRRVSLVREAMCRLHDHKPEQHEAVFLRHLRDMQPKDIAVLTGKSPSRINSNVHYGLQSIAEILINMTDEPFYGTPKEQALIKRFRKEATRAGRSRG